VRFLARRAWQRLLRERAAAGLDAPLPDSELALHDAPLLALDLEMTGLDAEHDRIVSFGWAPIDRGRLRPGDGDHVLVRADGEDGGDAGVGGSAIIHGIRDCDRLPGRPLAEALDRLFEALAGRVPLVHHAELDHAFVDRACRRVRGHGWPTPMLDTLAWERMRRQRRGDDAESGGLTLDALRRQYGLPRRNAHNALADAISCGELALAMMARSPGRLIDSCRRMH